MFLSPFIQSLLRNCRASMAIAAKFRKQAFETLYVRGCCGDAACRHITDGVLAKE
ncbi:hypothetical protein IB259_23430 [Achromobacter sp. ACM04]|uniref:hypothetical protein n=1 Tax=unclassified Achromobacter TaxID=2626865 RepID=UPI001782629C|nr:MULTISPECIES: hypothetical protein [unclassified Achromobacter]MBD9422219.1 hypothetical protein [Achromobacter sp. ACM04]MBD9475388.1 hypothetical protein [Achromobacter sp. ACM01]